MLNNGTLGFLEMANESQRVSSYWRELGQSDFAAMARAIGIHGVRVDDPSALESAVKEVLNHPGPALPCVLFASIFYRMRANPHR